MLKSTGRTTLYGWNFEAGYGVGPGSGPHPGRNKIGAVASEDTPAQQRGTPPSDSRTVTDKTPDHIRQHYFAPLRPVKGV